MPQVLKWVAHSPQVLAQVLPHVKAQVLAQVLPHVKAQVF